MTRRIVFRIGLPVLLLLSSASPTASCAQEATINGFRSAQFGMDQAQLELAIARDFHADPATVSLADNPVEHTRVMTVRLPALEPAPGPAIVTYILGATTHRLIHVNVTWTSALGAADAERMQIATAGLQLASHLREQYAQPGVATAGLPDASGVVLFAVANGRNAAIQLRLSGVSIDSKLAPPPAAAAPAQLTLSYIANLRRPDVAGAAASKH